MSNLNDLTAFESSVAERTAGMSLASLDDKNAPKVALLGALAWVHVKRTEPGLKYEEYMKRVTANEVADYLFGGDVDEDSSEAGFLDGDGGGAADGAGADEGAVLSGDGDRAE
ncbi:MAG: hypothetical protein CMF72_24725 [Mameliella sp.]|nr:hypothetical protein [Mameliella sp.]|tara:strand:+ start:154 stop:492 length:339 start_codon:yes stop_codon:yes gene_type:complete